MSKAIFLLLPDWRDNAIQSLERNRTTYYRLVTDNKGKVALVVFLNGTNFGYGFYPTENDKVLCLIHIDKIHRFHRTY